MPVRVAWVRASLTNAQLQWIAFPPRHPLAAGRLSGGAVPRPRVGRPQGSRPGRFLRRLRHVNEELAMSSISTVASHRPGRLARTAGRVVRLLRTLELALQVRHERRLLLAMDDRTLKDLGLHGVAYGEATRRFWDVPLDRQSAINQRRA